MNERPRPTLRGFVERCNAKQVSGWVVDSASDGPAVVSLHAGKVKLYSARADIFRKDIEKATGSQFGGFMLRMGEKLRAVLPSGEMLSVLVDGVPIPPLRGVSCEINNRACSSFEALQEYFDNGWKVSSKSGELYRPLSRRGSDQDRLLQALDHCAGVMEREFGLDLMLAYGTLLGAVREGDFIGHDDDVDAIFYARSQSTHDANEEFCEVVTQLRELGERIRVVRSGQFHWSVPGLGVVDVFMGWFNDGCLFSYCSGGVEMTREDVRAVAFSFKGHETAIPAGYERILEATYGSSWRVPDPLFQWRISQKVKLQMDTLQRAWEARSSEVLSKV